jgi:hypothetical protein
MAVSTDITNILSSDNKPTFRKLLQNLVSNSTVSSILIGENHDDHLVEDLVLANLDVLAKSRRQVILIFENLKQSDNSSLRKALDKAKKDSSNPLKKVEVLQDFPVQFFTIVLGAVTHNIIVLGAENKTSNPFSSIKDSEMTRDILRAMEKFQKSPDRIVKTNEEFANLVNESCRENTIPIFIGGAAHPITLSQDGQVFDPGLQGRIKNSVSIYVLEAFKPDFQTSYAYHHTDRKVQGIYDFQIVSNKKILYKETFDSLPQLMDKINFLTNTLDNLIKAHLFFAKNSTYSLHEEAHAILSAFQESINEKVEFPTFDRILNELIAVKNSTEKSQGFFSPKTSKEPGYSKESLTTAIFHDLASVLKNEITDQIKIKYEL